MLIDKNKLIENKWKNVEKYLKKDNDDAIKLAIIESENIFLELVKARGFKKNKIDDQLSLAIKEIKRPESFLKAREIALNIKNNPGFNISDIYSGREIVDTYKEAIKDILFGIIDEKKMASVKYRFWNIYYSLFTKRRSVYKFLILFLIIIFLMLFIADTSLGKNTFEFLIDKIHIILRTILFVVFIIFLVVFFVTFSIIILETKGKKRHKRTV